MKRILFVFLAALTALPALGQSRAGTTAATFLTIGTGARGSSLGHAYTAIASGPDALFWNPGGASRAPRAPASSPPHHAPHQPS